MTCGKGTETSDLVCPPASHPRAIGPNGVGAGKVDFSGGISQKPVPANFRMGDDPLIAWGATYYRPWSLM